MIIKENEEQINISLSKKDSTLDESLNKRLNNTHDSIIQICTKNIEVLNKKVTVIDTLLDKYASK